MKNLLQKSFAALLLISSVTLASCGPNTTPQTSDNDIPSTNENSIPSSSEDNRSWWEKNSFTDRAAIKVEPEDVVIADNDFHTPDQEAYIQSSWDTYGDHSFNGRKEASKPRGVKIVQDAPTDTFVKISMDENFTDSFIYKLNDANQPFVKNLLANHDYFYKTSSIENTFEGPTKTIKTANCLPRNLDIDGVTNVRDLGGYESELGGTIKQNMFIRGARLTDSNLSTPDRLITDKGYETLTKVIGVKTEIDLRSDEKETSNMNNDVFPDIEYVNIRMTTYGVDNLMTEHKDQIKEVFTLLAKKETYPVYLHCTIGTDRTGMVSFLLGALLGMNLEMLMTDYLFSNFGWIRGMRMEYDVQESYFDYLKNTYNLENLQLSAEAFLKDCGITASQIESIKSLLIEK